MGLPERAGDNFSPITNAAVLAEETGEVARIMARRLWRPAPQAGDRTELADLADELADLIWVAAAIANQTGIDLTDAIARNIEKKNLRDSDRFKK